MSMKRISSPGSSTQPNLPKGRNIVYDSDEELDDELCEDDPIQPGDPSPTNEDVDMMNRIKESSARPRKMEGRQAPKISNAEINQSIKSLESRIGKLEEGQSEIIRLLNQMIQSTPTFLSSGTTGALKSTSKLGTATLIRPSF